MIKGWIDVKPVIDDKNGLGHCCEVDATNNGKSTALAKINKIQSFSKGVVPHSGPNFREIVFMKYLMAILLSGGFLTTNAQNADLKTIDRLQGDIQKYMQLSRVAGLSVGVIYNGRLIWQQGFGVMNTETGKPVTSQTVFECNSLSKPVFAYGVMQLVRSGRLNLDTPVVRYMDTGWHISRDSRINLVTARMLLSHSSGLKDISENEAGFNFNPGERWQYAPAGYQVLTQVVERITSEPIEQYMKEAVLAPLGMVNSSFTWLPQYDSLRAYSHNWQGKVAGPPFKWQHGAGCCSLQSTPEDYSRFIIAIMHDTTGIVIPQIKTGTEWPDIAWGIGWGLEMHGTDTTIWHWGDGGNSKDYIVADLAHNNAVVLFSNSQNGLFFVRELLTMTLGRKYQSPEFLGYQRYDSPSWLALESIMANGAAAFLQTFHKDSLSEAQLNTIGYRLTEAGKLADAVAILQRNAADHPASANAWDSLAEACAKAGDEKAARQYYQKSLQLKPANKKAENWLRNH